MATTRTARGAIGVALIAVLLVGTITTGAFGASGCNCAVQHQADRGSAAGNPSGWAVYMETLASREAHQVGGLILNRRLSNLARDHSRAMAVDHRLFHSPNPGLYLSGTGWSSWGENVGWTTGTTSDLQQSFMSSLVHRDNILDNQFQQVGVGSVRVGDTLWVTVFFYG